MLLGGPAVFLGLLEGVLALCGVGYPTSFFIEGERPGLLTTNIHFGWHYQQETLAEPQPCLLPADKPEGAIRIFVLGESAAMGTPDPSFGFVRILELMLRRHFPGRPVEVVNAAMRGINSHVIKDIAKECTRLDPDLFVLYIGNNELNGLYAPKTSVSFFGRHPALIPLFHFAKQTRTGQLLRRMVGANPEARQSHKRARDTRFFLEHRTAMDDPDRGHVYRNFRVNLERICRHALEAGPGVILSTISVNLRDCPPLGSLHRPDLTPLQKQQWQQLHREGIRLETAGNTLTARSCYQKALAIDDHYAETHFRAAGCQLRAGELDAAKRHFILARDWDALPFRADSRINTIIREVADQLSREGPELPDRSIRLVAVDQILGESEPCADGIPGEEFFYEHVHLRFLGDYQVASAMLPAIVEGLRQRGMTGVEVAEIPALEECARELAFTTWDEVNTAAAMVQLTTRPPFTGQLDHAQRQAAAEKAIAAVTDHIDDRFINQVLQEYREAIEARPDDWILKYNLGTFLHQLERPAEAAIYFEHVVETLPDFAPFRVLLGYALGKAGRTDPAIHQFREALRRDRRDKAAREGLEWARKLKQAGR